MFWQLQNRVTNSRNLMLQAIANHALLYPTPVNFSYAYSFGSLVGLFFALQMLTCIFLAMHYTAHTSYAFASVVHIMTDVENITYWVWWGKFSTFLTVVLIVFFLISFLRYWKFCVMFVFWSNLSLTWIYDPRWLFAFLMLCIGYLIVSFGFSFSQISYFWSTLNKKKEIRRDQVRFEKKIRQTFYYQSLLSLFDCLILLELVLHGKIMCDKNLFIPWFNSISWDVILWFFIFLKIIWNIVVLYLTTYIDSQNHWTETKKKYSFLIFKVINLATFFFRVPMLTCFVNYLRDFEYILQSKYWIVTLRRPLRESEKIEFYEKTVKFVIDDVPVFKNIDVSQNIKFQMQDWATQNLTVFLPKFEGGSILAIKDIVNTLTEAKKLLWAQEQLGLLLTEEHNFLMMSKHLPQANGFFSSIYNMAKNGISSLYNGTKKNISYVYDDLPAKISEGVSLLHPNVKNGLEIILITIGTALILWLGYKSIGYLRSSSVSTNVVPPSNPSSNNDSSSGASSPSRPSSRSSNSDSSNSNSSSGALSPSRPSSRSSNSSSSSSSSSNVSNSNLQPWPARDFLLPNAPVAADATPDLLSPVSSEGSPPGSPPEAIVTFPNRNWILRAQYGEQIYNSSGQFPHPVVANVPPAHQIRTMVQQIALVPDSTVPDQVQTETDSFWVWLCKKIFFFW